MVERLYMLRRRVVVRRLCVLGRLAACRVYVLLQHDAVDRLYVHVHVHVHVRRVMAVQLCVLGWCGAPGQRGCTCSGCALRWVGCVYSSIPVRRGGCTCPGSMLQLLD